MATLSELEDRINRLSADVVALRLEADARRVLGRYMFLCDVPLPEFGMSEEERADAIAELFTENAIWEGVGGAHGAQFGQKVGRPQIREHFLAFYTGRTPRQIFNTHYVCSEQIQASDSGATGQWVQFQPWVDAEGGTILRSSRLHVSFEYSLDRLRIARYRTENIFIAPLPEGWASSRIETAVLMAPF